MSIFYLSLRNHFSTFSSNRMRDTKHVASSLKRAISVHSYEYNNALNTLPSAHDPSKYTFPKLTGFSLLNSAGKVQQDWVKHDNVSVINGKPVSIDTNAVICKDIYGLSNGFKYPLSDEQFASFLELKKAQKELGLLVVSPEKLEASASVATEMLNYTASEEGQLNALSSAVADGLGNKNEEVQEGFGTGFKLKRIQDSRKDKLERGQLVHNVYADGIYLGEVENFRIILDEQQKIISSLFLGVPVTVIDRLGHASQQSRNFFDKLVSLLNQNGLSDMFARIILNEDQLLQLGKELNPTLCLTGSTKTMENVHANAIENGNADLCLSGNGKSSIVFFAEPTPAQIEEIGKAISIGGNGGQCTHAEEAIFVGHSIKNVINPLSQFLNTNSYATYSSLVQQMTDQNKYYGSIPSDLAPTPYGTNLVKETPFYKILERTSETPDNIGEELVKPWRQPQILLSNVDDLSSAIDNVGRDEHLSLGVYENPDLSKELNYKYFTQLTIASNTTVATFNGPCTWTMPYYPAEFFNHAMKRLNSDNVLVTMSPREQIVPNGVPVTGFSQTYLKNSQFLLNQNKNNHLHHTFSDCWEKDCGMDDNRKLIFKGHVSEVKVLLNTAIQVSYRAGRGAAVAGWLPDYADQNKVHIVPDVCPSTGHTILEEDMWMQLFLLKHTSVGDNVKYIALNSDFYANYRHLVEDYLGQDNSSLMSPINIVQLDHSAIQTAQIKIPTFSTCLNHVPSLASSILGGYGHAFHAKDMSEGNQINSAKQFIQSMVQELPFIGHKDSSELAMQFDRLP